MASPKNNSNPTFGFLTVVDDARFGLCGGYLVLNPAGRPLEFHCTAPIKPNRAQEILYGPTLHDFLYGEQIGGALIGNGRRSAVVGLYRPRTGAGRASACFDAIGDGAGRFAGRRRG